MHALAANPAEWNMGDKAPMRLSVRAQITTGIIIALALAGSFLLTHGSFLLFEAMIGAAAAFLIVQSPVASLLAFIVLNVAITIHGKDSTSGGFSGFDLVLGGMLVLITAYWLIRMRVWERSSLSTSVGQLSLVLFFVWAVIVTAIGLTGEHTDANNAIRELLNLSPLLVLPAIYERNVKLGSKAEKWIFISVLTAGVLLVGWSLLQIHHNIAQAVYLYEVGRSNFDEMLPALLVIVGISFLMSTRNFWRSLPFILLVFWGTAGIIISSKRNLYVGILLCAAVMLWMGTPVERKRGIKNGLLTTVLALTAIAPIYYSSRFFRLLLEQYWLRLLSSGRVTTDLSLVNRYVEWKYVLQAIFRSPILGSGFGGRYRTFNIIKYYHDWTAFSHSSFLYVAFKTGIIGEVLFFVAFFSFLLKGFRLLKSATVSASVQIYLRIGLGYLIAVFLNFYTEPVVDSKTDLIWVAIVWGYFLVIERYSNSLERKAIFKF